jgi:hypothetical protein
MKTYLERKAWHTVQVQRAAADCLSPNSVEKKNQKMIAREEDLEVEEVPFKIKREQSYLSCGLQTPVFC